MKFLGKVRLIAIRSTAVSLGIALLLSAANVNAQLTDQTQTPNLAGQGIALSLQEQIG